MLKLKKKHILINALSIVFLFGCKSTNNLNIFGNKSLSLKESYFTAINNEFTKDLKIKYLADFEYKDVKNKISGNINFIKDTLVSVQIVSRTLGIEIARVFFMPNNVLIINKINKQYYSGSYSYLNKQIGFNTSFIDIKNILLGYISDLPFSYTNSSLNYFKSYTTDSLYIFKYEVNNDNNLDDLKIKNPLVNHNFKIDKLGRLKESEYMNLNNSNFFNLKYNYDKAELPNSIELAVNSNKGDILIDLDYKQISNQIRNLNMDIPKNYIQIK